MLEQLGRELATLTPMALVDIIRRRFSLRQQQRNDLRATPSLGFNLRSMLNSSPSLLVRLPRLTFRISRSASSRQPVRSARLLGLLLCSFGRCSACSLCGELFPCAQRQALSCPSHYLVAFTFCVCPFAVSSFCASVGHFAHFPQFAVALCGNFDSNVHHQGPTTSRAEHQRFSSQNRKSRRGKTCNRSSDQKSSEKTKTMPRTIPREETASVGSQKANVHLELHAHSNITRKKERQRERTTSFTLSDRSTARKFHKVMEMVAITEMQKAGKRNDYFV